MKLTAHFRLILLLPLFMVGCAGIHIFDSSHKYIQPTMAVIKFENKAPLPYKWSIGEGMSDLLVNRLKESGRFAVLEREDLGALLDEIELQNTGYTRNEERVQPRRLKNANYLVKGVVRDFSHVARAKAGIGYKFYLFGGQASVALVSLVVTVIEVETGEIVLSEDISKRIYSGSINAEGIYNNVAFGGELFFATPLGKATKQALDDATVSIVRSIGRRKWQPVIADMDGGKIILNGGKDRRLRVGNVYYVIEKGEEIFDPVTGNSLGYTEGKKIGMVQVTSVMDNFSYCCLLDGAAKEGYVLQVASDDAQGGLK